VGDYVAHPGHGGCTIQGICDRNFGGASRKYFILIPKTDPNTTILAPVENVEKIGLREIISEEKADQILSYITYAEVDWVSDHAKRRNAYEATLKDGNLKSIAKMIKELTVHGQEATLNHCDKEILPKAQKRLYSEIALAKGIEVDSVLVLMNQAIRYTQSVPLQ